MTAFLPILGILLVLTLAGWVYSDAKTHLTEGRPVIVTIGAFHIDEPVVWFVLCLFFWIVLLPIYLAIRSRT